MRGIMLPVCFQVKDDRSVASVGKAHDFSHSALPISERIGWNAVIIETDSTIASRAKAAVDKFLMPRQSYDVGISCSAFRHFDWLSSRSFAASWANVDGNAR